MPWRENPATVRPMLASLDEPPIDQAGLVYEPKYDGIRALVDVRPPARRGGEPTVALYSRNGREKHAQFPGIVRALADDGAEASTARCSSTAKSSRSTRAACRSGSSTSRDAST